MADNECRAGATPAQAQRLAARHRCGALIPSRGRSRPRTAHHESPPPQPPAGSDHAILTVILLDASSSIRSSGRLNGLIGAANGP
jgi:hypothetical protein